MLYRITNNGEARTVDFLAVFAKGETKEFNEAEIASWSAMGGASPVNLLPEDMDVEFVGQTEGEGK